MVSERILEEFLDRLTPKISFHVKDHVPTTVEEALQLAKRYESLLTDVASTMLVHGIFPDVQINQAQSVGQPLGASSMGSTSANRQNGAVSSVSNKGQGNNKWDEDRGIYEQNRSSRWYQSNANHIQYTAMPMQFQPGAYYPIHPQFPTGQQPVYWNHAQPSMMMPVPMQQPMQTAPAQQMMTGQVPSTCALTAPSLNSEIALEHKISQLQSKLHEARKRSEELLVKHNELFERVYNSKGNLQSVKRVHM